MRRGAGDWVQAVELRLERPEEEAEFPERREGDRRSWGGPGREVDVQTTRGIGLCDVVRRDQIHDFPNLPQSL